MVLRIFLDRRLTALDRPLIGTFGLTVVAACAFPLAITGQVLTFRTDARSSFAPSICRMPFGPYQDIARTDPGKRAMAAKNRRHEVLRDQLNNYWARRLPDTTLRLSPTNAPEPDFIFYPSRLKAPDVTGPDLRLAVECADSSLSYDLGRKASVYASHGIAEYWVVNANTHVTTIHREPGPEGCASIVAHSSTMRLTPHLVPGLAVRLADRDLE